MGSDVDEEVRAYQAEGWQLWKAFKAGRISGDDYQARSDSLARMIDEARAKSPSVPSPEPKVRSR